MGVKTAVVSNKPDATTKALAEKFSPVCRPSANGTA